MPRAPWILPCLALCALLPSSLLAKDAPPPGFDAGYDALIKRYVDAQGQVDYARLKRQDERTLRACVQRMAAQDPSKWTKAQRMAYWINAYNALTIQAMLEFWPVKTILKAGQGKHGKGFNVFKAYPLKGKLTLDTIEHKILRPLGDPRIHAAIVCASQGCPPLRAEAYDPRRLDKQLEDNVRTWFKSPTRGLKIVGKTLHLSQIFDWFGKDFGPDWPTRLRWIARYVDPKTKAFLLSNPPRKPLDWDWTPNAQPRK